MSNESYTKFLSFSKNLFNGKRKNHGAVLLSEAQMRVAAEFQRINGEIRKISNTQTCVLCCTADTMAEGYMRDTMSEISSLLQYSDLHHKNIKAIYCKDVNAVLERCGSGLHGIPVTNKNEILEDADFIVVAAYTTHIRDELELIKRGFGDKIIRIYNEDSIMPLNHRVNPHYLSQINKRFTLNNHNYAFSIELSQLELSFLKNVKRINDKLAECCSAEDRVLIYGAGDHTFALLNLTNIVFYNVVGVADRNKREFCGMATRTTERSSFEDVDKIVISSLLYREEIVEFLISIGQKNKVVSLYNKSDSYEFYITENIYAPDISYAIERTGKYSKSEINIGMERLADDYTTNSDYYVDYSITRLFGDDVESVRDNPELNTFKDYYSVNSETAIVMQGPIVYKKDFTYYSLKQLGYTFPGAAIVLSTWRSEIDNPDFNKIKELGVDIVYCEVPDIRGVSNINLQVESSYQGIMHAKQLGKQYALKLRTDFLIKNKSVLSFLNLLVKRFPLKVCASKQKTRIAVQSCRIDVPWFIPDL